MKTIYEASNRIIPSIPLVFVIIADIVVICVTIALWKKSSISFKIFFIFVSFILALVAFSVIYTGIDSTKLYREYRAGKALVVEGEIENYSANEEQNELPDTFSVNEISFSTFSATPYGYSTRQKDGGVLHDGCKVRIYYLPYKLENVIMKIELFE